MQRFRSMFWAMTLAALPWAAPVAAADTLAACKKQAAADYTANVKSCERNLRWLPARLRQCRNDAKTRHDRALAECDARARKAGGGQMDIFGPDPPPPPPLPPKDSKPK